MYLKGMSRIISQTFLVILQSNKIDIFYRINLNLSFINPIIMNRLFQVANNYEQPSRETQVQELVQTEIVQAVGGFQRLPQLSHKVSILLVPPLRMDRPPNPNCHHQTGELYQIFRSSKRYKCQNCYKEVPFLGLLHWTSGD